jgi:hypothetical protein
MREVPGATIETVRGELTTSDAGRVLSLWEQSGVLTGDGARERLAEVLCILREADGSISGVNWAFPDDVALVGGRRFWMYQGVLATQREDAAPAMIEQAFVALDRDFDPEGTGPIGVCVVLRDPAEMRRRPEAEWADPRMLYAGYLPDGGQVRVGYFAGATI